MPSSEFSEWMALERVEPLGAERDDWRSALMASQIINHLGAALGSKVQVRPKDLLLRFEAAALPSFKTVMMKLLSWKSTMNGKSSK